MIPSNRVKQISVRIGLLAVFFICDSFFVLGETNPRLPLIGVPDFGNRTDGHMTRIAPGRYREQNVKVGSDRRTEALDDGGSRVQTDSRRDVYEKQLEREVEYAPGAWRLPNSASAIAADEVSLVLTRAGRFNVLSRTQSALVSREHERAFSIATQGYTPESLRLFRDLNANFLVVGNISSFRVDETRAAPYGIQMIRVNTRVNLDLSVIDVATGQVVYQNAPTKSVSFPLPANTTASEVYDWELSLRTAVREASEGLVIGIAKSTGASVAGLEQFSINVRSTPPGADIIVNGDFMGNTPTEIIIDKGRHEIAIERQGFQPWMRTVNAFDGLQINPTLEPNPEPPLIKEMQ